MLGIGARVAAGKLRDGAAGAAAAVEQGKRERAGAGAEALKAGHRDPGTEPRGSGATAGAAGVSAAGVGSAAGLAEGSRRLARGAGRFGGALWKPFAHATGVLWLQITGLFFAFFALGFAGYAWRLYQSAGVHDHRLGLYGFFAVLFLWFAVSSFWRAGRKKRG